MLTIISYLSLLITILIFTIIIYLGLIKIQLI
jgi:hypothetical protein